jgi:hypothetical protein
MGGPVVDHGEELAELPDVYGAAFPRRWRRLVLESRTDEPAYR